MALGVIRVVKQHRAAMLFTIEVQYEDWASRNSLTERCANLKLLTVESKITRLQHNRNTWSLLRGSFGRSVVEIAVRNWSELNLHRLQRSQARAFLVWTRSASALYSWILSRISWYSAFRVGGSRPRRSRIASSVTRSHRAAS
jgi:hypothetical protein